MPGALQAGLVLGLDWTRGVWAGNKVVCTWAAALLCALLTPCTLRRKTSSYRCLYCVATLALLHAINTINTGQLDGRLGCSWLRQQMLYAQPGQDLPESDSCYGGWH